MQLFRLCKQQIYNGCSKSLRKIITRMHHRRQRLLHEHNICSRHPESSQHVTPVFATNHKQVVTCRMSSVCSIKNHQITDLHFLAPASPPRARRRRIWLTGATSAPDRSTQTHPLSSAIFFRPGSTWRAPFPGSNSSSAMTSSMASSSAFI